MSDYVDAITGKRGIYAKAMRLSKAKDTLEIVKIIREEGGLYGNRDSSDDGSDGKPVKTTTAKRIKAKITFLPSKS